MAACLRTSSTKSENRYGQSLVATLGGIGGAFIADTADLTLKGIQASSIRRSEVGRAAAKYVGRYTPILSSHPLTRAWYRRAFVDQLQWLVDPDADKKLQGAEGASLALVGAWKTLHSNGFQTQMLPFGQE